VICQQIIKADETAFVLTQNDEPSPYFNYCRSRGICTN